MIEDDVVREVRSVRETFAASHGFDVRKMVAALHDLGVASGRELVRLAPRPALVGPNLPPTGTAFSAPQDSMSPGGTGG